MLLSSPSALSGSGSASATPAPVRGYRGSTMLFDNILGGIVVVVLLVYLVLALIQPERF